MRPIQVHVNKVHPGLAVQCKRAKVYCACHEAWVPEGAFDVCPQALKEPVLQDSEEHVSIGLFLCSVRVVFGEDPCRVNCLAVLQPYTAAGSHGDVVDRHSAHSTANADNKPEGTVCWSNVSGCDGTNALFDGLGAVGTHITSAHGERGRCLCCGLGVVNDRVLLALCDVEAVDHVLHVPVGRACFSDVYYEGVVYVVNGTFCLGW